MTEHPTPPVAATGDPAPHYLPAMGRRWLLPLYDPFTRLIGARRVHGQLLDRAEINPGSRVLEIGCGTGNLLLLAKRRFPATEVTGLDPDPAALRRTRRKANRAGLAMRLDRGFASDLPYPDASIDLVLSAFMLHHLDPADLPRALAEVRRVLRPGGSLHIVDISDGHHAHGPLRWLFVARRHRHPTNSPPQRLLAQLSEAGLKDAAQTGHHHTPMGTVTFYRATH